MVQIVLGSGTEDKLGDWVKIAQIVFYFFGVLGVCGTVTLGVLTYRAATRGWLTPVNAEYQKRVMDRLTQLSKDLYEEFEWPTEPQREGSVTPSNAEIAEFVAEYPPP
jgi:hypothetical protein